MRIYKQFQKLKRFRHACYPLSIFLPWFPKTKTTNIKDRSNTKEALSIGEVNL